MSETPAAKRPRTAADGTPSTPATRDASAHGRVELDVGGTRFVSSRSSLEGASSYFRALFGRWSSDEQPLFLDCDADAFQVLLSYIRLPSSVILPQETGLATRVLGLAEYLGVDGFLAAVKTRAHANMHPDDAEVDDPVAAFDEEAGTLQQALERGLLPARFFAPVPPPPEPPEPPPEAPLRTIKSIIPVSGYEVVFADEYYVQSNPSRRDLHQLKDIDHVRRPVVALALVEHRDGGQVVDAVMQPGAHDLVDPNNRNEHTHSQMVLASEFAETIGGEGPWEHWIVRPLATAQQLMPIPPGAVRGCWQQPVFTPKDRGETVKIAGDLIEVGGETRAVDWGAIEHEDLTGKIAHVDHRVRGQITLRKEGGVTKSFQNPAAGGDSAQYVDLAFAQVVDEGGGDGTTLETRFYMPLAENDDEEGTQTNKLQDARRVNIGDQVFSHFIGAVRQ